MAEFGIGIDGPQGSSISVKGPVANTSAGQAANTISNAVTTATNIFAKQQATDLSAAKFAATEARANRTEARAQRGEARQVQALVRTDEENAVVGNFSTQLTKLSQAIEMGDMNQAQGQSLARQLRVTALANNPTHSKAILSAAGNFSVLGKPIREGSSSFQQFVKDREAGIKAGFVYSDSSEAEQRAGIALHQQELHLLAKIGSKKAQQELDNLPTVQKNFEADADIKQLNLTKAQKAQTDAEQKASQLNDVSELAALRYPVTKEKVNRLLVQFKGGKIDEEVLQHELNNMLTDIGQTQRQLGKNLDSTVLNSYSAPHVGYIEYALKNFSNESITEELTAQNDRFKAQVETNFRLQNPELAAMLHLANINGVAENPALMRQLNDRITSIIVAMTNAATMPPNTSSDPNDPFGNPAKVITDVLRAGDTAVANDPVNTNQEQHVTMKNQFIAGFNKSFPGGPITNSKDALDYLASPEFNESMGTHGSALDQNQLTRAGSVIADRIVHDVAPFVREVYSRAIADGSTKSGMRSAGIDPDEIDLIVRGNQVLFVGKPISRLDAMNRRRTPEQIAAELNQKFGGVLTTTTQAQANLSQASLEATFAVLKPHFFRPEEEEEEASAPAEQSVSAEEAPAEQPRNMLPDTPVEPTVEPTAEIAAEPTAEPEEIEEIEEGVGAEVEAELDAAEAAEEEAAALAAEVEAEEVEAKAIEAATEAAAQKTADREAGEAKASAVHKKSADYAKKLVKSNEALRAALAEESTTPESLLASLKADVKANKEAAAESAAEEKALATENAKLAKEEAQAAEELAKVETAAKERKKVVDAAAKEKKEQKRVADAAAKEEKRVADAAAKEQKRVADAAAAEEKRVEEAELAADLAAITEAEEVVAAKKAVAQKTAEREAAEVKASAIRKESADYAKKLVESNAAGMAALADGSTTPRNLLASMEGQVKAAQEVAEKNALEERTLAAEVARLAEEETKAKEELARVEAAEVERQKVEKQKVADAVVPEPGVAEQVAEQVAGKVAEMQEAIEQMAESFDWQGVRDAASEAGEDLSGAAREALVKGEEQFNKLKELFSAVKTGLPREIEAKMRGMGMLVDPNADEQAEVVAAQLEEEVPSSPVLAEAGRVDLAQTVGSPLAVSEAPENLVERLPTDEVKPIPFDTGAFITKLGVREGTQTHASKEGGVKTQPFGVKHTMGLKKRKGETARAFGIRVLDKHVESATKKIGKATWDKISPDVQAAVMDLHWNTGSVGSKFKTEANAAIAKAEKNGTEVDWEPAMKETMDTLTVTQETTLPPNIGRTGPNLVVKGSKFFVPGLAKRRAEVWNDTFPNNKIDKIVFTTKNGRTTADYQDSQGNTIDSYSSNKRVSNNFLTLKGDGVYTQKVH